MSKRSSVIKGTIVCVLAVATAAMAGDPSVGTWKMNIAKSTIPPALVGRVAKENTLVKREVNSDQFEAVFRGTNADGSLSYSKSTVPQKGGVVSYEQSTSLKTVVTVIGPGNCFVTYMTDDKQFRVEHWKVSEDGQTMLETDFLTNAQGKRVELQFLWERQ